MTADPLTNREAAEAFSKRYKAGAHLQPQALMSWGAKRGQPRCCALSVGGYQYDQCSNAGKVQTIDGEWWCGVHSPAAAAKRAERRRQERERERAAAEAARRRALDRNPHIQALLAIARGDNDPRTTARQALGALWAELAEEA